MRKYCILTLFAFAQLLLAVPHATAQDDCDNSLYTAHSLYEGGNIVEAIDMLEPCLGSFKADEEQFEAYHLLAISCFAIGDLRYLDEYILNMLKIQPDYNKYPNDDPISFRNAIQKYTVVPKLKAGISLGLAYHAINLKESYSAYDAEQSYKASLGYQFGIQVEYNYKTQLGLNAELRAIGGDIKHEITGLGLLDKTYNEKFGMAGLAMGFKYYQAGPQARRLFAGLDLGFDLIHQSSMSVVTNNEAARSIIQLTANGLAQRNRLQTSMKLKGGVDIALRRGNVGFELSYNHYFRTVVAKDKRLDNTEFIFDTQYVNDDIKFRFVQIGMSYSLPIIYGIQKLD